MSVGDETAPSGRDVHNHGLFQAIEEMDDDCLKTKQSVAVLAITLTAGQLLALMLQLSMCGMAPFEANGFVGPHPVAFSQWGGKNSHLMIKENEWWRLVSPSLLNIGALHPLANSFCQLDAITLFEQEWGSFRWLIVRLISSVGCSALSSAFDPNSIAVGSSGALMAQLAPQVTSLTCFEVKNFKVDEIVQLDQLSSVLCGLTLVSILSSFAHIDWSGHIGGLSSGFLSDIVLFSGPIQSCCSKFFWTSFGLLGLLRSLAGIACLSMEKATPDEDLGDACEHFCSFFPEDYNCDCMVWE